MLNATNPFAAVDGADEETDGRVQRLAPQAFRAQQFRAVRPEDYERAAETLPWVQNAGTVFRWTGSWLTVFTTADPRGSEQIPVGEHTELIDLLNRYRLAGYESYTPAPEYEPKAVTRSPEPSPTNYSSAQTGYITWTGDVEKNGKKLFWLRGEGWVMAGLARTVHDASDTIIEGAAKPRAYTAYTDPSGVFTVGVWACDPGTLAINDLAIDEACYLIQGEVIISDANGNSERFTAGDAFLLQRGFVGLWHMPGPIIKYNAMFKR